MLGCKSLSRLSKSLWIDIVKVSPLNDLSRPISSKGLRSDFVQFVLTKSDKIKASALAETHDKAAAEAKKHPAAYPEIHLTSAEKGQGIAALRAAIVADALTP